MANTQSQTTAQSSLERGATILVVDDAPVNLKLMRLLLTHEGYDVRTAGHAEEALELLTDFRPELVLADIRMPGMDGLEMTRRIKADPRTRELRVVALTGCAMDSDRQMALNAGCEDFISKPIDSAALASRIRELLATRPGRFLEQPPEPPAAPQDFGLSDLEVETLRRNFLSSGTVISRHLLETIGAVFDPVQAGMHLHKWAGTAGLLGFSEISRLAAQAEQMLRGHQCGDPAFHALLTGLCAAFSVAESSESISLPANVTEALVGRRIALVGFEPAAAGRMCALLERVNARPLLFDSSEDISSLAIRACALVILQVRAELLESSWLKSSEPASAVAGLVLMGSRRDLLALTPGVRLLAAEFLVDDWDPEEALMRLASVRQRSAPPVPAPQRTVVARPTVVIADDDSFIVTLVSSTLENYGMICHAAHNGREALDAIREAKPHLAVLDVNMPELDGYEVLAAIRAEGLPTKVVLLTARQQEKEVVRGFELGADDYLTKPFNPFELAARAKRLLRR